MRETEHGDREESEIGKERKSTHTQTHLQKERERDREEKARGGEKGGLWGMSSWP